MLDGANNFTACLHRRICYPISISSLLLTSNYSQVIFGTLLVGHYVLKNLISFWSLIHVPSLQRFLCDTHVLSPQFIPDETYQFDFCQTIRQITAHIHAVIPCLLVVA
jgi:hypothetical protein